MIRQRREAIKNFFAMIVVPVAAIGPLFETIRLEKHVV